MAQSRESTSSEQSRSGASGASTTGSSGERARGGSERTSSEGSAASGGAGMSGQGTEIIGQAQGILMERERITADQAFDLLRRSSQHLNVKLRDVAQELVDTGAVPGGPAGMPKALPPDR